MRRSQRVVQRAVLLTRWLMAPFLFGLACCLVLLIYRFFADFIDMAGKVATLGWHELVVEELDLVDVALTANLVLIVIFSSYENFIHKIEREGEGEEGWPAGLTDVDFGALKQRLLGSIVVIAAVDALAWYLDLEKYSDTAKLPWVLAFPLMLVVATLLFAIADWLGRQRNRT